MFCSVIHPAVTLIIRKLCNRILIIWQIKRDDWWHCQQGVNILLEDCGRLCTEHGLNAVITDKYTTHSFALQTLR